MDNDNEVPRLTSLALRALEDGLDHLLALEAPSSELADADHPRPFGAAAAFETAPLLSSSHAVLDEEMMARGNPPPLG
jgi:hypothetical protein